MSLSTLFSFKDMKNNWFKAVLGSLMVQAVLGNAG